MVRINAPHLPHIHGRIGRSFGACWRRVLVVSEPYGDWWFLVEPDEVEPA